MVNHSNIEIRERFSQKAWIGMESLFLGYGLLVMSTIRVDYTGVHVGEQCDVGGKFRRMIGQAGIHGLGYGLLFSMVLVACQAPSDEGVREVEWQGWQWQDTGGMWRSASVPGSIHTDLMEEGLIRDPFEGTAEWEVQWVEERDWRYRCPVPPPPPTGEWSLEFQGLDTYAEVRVNGGLVLRADNMHRSWRIPLASMELNGRDTVEVLFLNPVREGQVLLDAAPFPVPVSNEARPVGQQTSAFTRKAMYHYGWDWGPRLVTVGIWQPVRWVRTDVELPAFRLVPVSVGAESAEYEVSWDEAVVDIQAQLALNGRPVPFDWFPEGPQRHRLVIHDPQRWWPNGMGEQPLYMLDLASGDGGRASWRFGVRTIHWNRNADGFGHAMQCVVNGVPVQVRGANVVPPDFFPVRALDLWPRVLDDAVAAHMNMIRVWGGAHYGDEVLYDLCDERGILVWQDFMNACAMVPGDEAWRANFLAEAQQQVKRLRNRTSLAIWAGNNETEKAWREWGWQELYGLHGADSVAVEEHYRQLFERDLPAAVADLGGGEYQSSSPHHLDEQRPRESGDQHDWGVWFGKAGFEFYSEEAGRFASEFGLQSLPDRRTLAAVGVRAYADTALQFRQRSKMEWLEPGFDGWDMMQFYAGEYFNDPEAARVPGLDRLDTWIYLTQLTQAEGLRQAIERHRCSGGRTSGSLYWQLDDVWPTVSWSTVDHAGRWKLAHHAVRHANQPVRILPDRVQGDRVAFEFVNDSPEAAQGVLEWELTDLAGKPVKSGRFGLAVAEHTTSSWASDEVRVVPDIHLLTWRWLSSDSAATVIDAGCHTFRPVGRLNWQGAEIQADAVGEAIRLRTDVPAAGVWLRSDEEGRFEDNGFFLLPGRERVVRFYGPSGELADPGAVSVVHFGQVQPTHP